jgi:K(+)-stimulated pyrophosphate-energized sodium pump
MMLISVELLIMLFILLFVPGDYAGPCFIGFAIGESLGAAALRIAGGIFTKIADIGADLMKIVFKIKEDDARNPGVIADCTGDNAGDSVGPSADGFETYGVTGVALITFILLGVKEPTIQVQLLVWIFVMRIMMLVSSALAYFINGAIAKARYGNANEMNFEHPLTSLVWLTSIVSIVATYIVSYFIIPNLGGDATQWWKLASIISCGTLAGALIPELVKAFTSGDFVQRGRRVAWNFVGLSSRKLFSILAWPSNGRSNVSGVLLQRDGPRRRCHHDRRARIRLRTGRLRILRHGPRNHRRRFLRPSHRQRSVRL